MRDGAKLGAYRVLRKIGEGGMGAVFVAEHTLLGRRAAIKVLLPELSARRHSVDRFFNEARATSTVSDPGIVQVFDFGYEGDTAYIVMELLEGEQLNARLKRIGALDPTMALRLARQTAGSLAAIHAAGLVHRDLKPDNLFVIRDPEAAGGERPKVLDFGIAKLGADERNRIVTRTGQVMGTPLYMSPEQCGGDAVDHRADIYSLGCVLFQMLTGRPPFRGGMVEVISAHLKDPPPVPSEMVVGLPAAVDDIVRRCLAKSRDERFATMAELQRACDAAIPLIAAMPKPVAPSGDDAVLPTLAADAATPPPRPTPQPRLTPQPRPTPYPPSTPPPRSSTPGLSAPGSMSAPPSSDVSPDKTSTINASVGEQYRSPPRRRALWGGLAIGAVAIGVAVAIALPRGSGPTPARAAPTTHAPVPIDTTSSNSAPSDSAPPSNAPSNSAPSSTVSPVSASPDSASSNATSPNAASPDTAASNTAASNTASSNTAASNTIPTRKAPATSTTTSKSHKPTKPAQPPKPDSSSLYDDR